MKKTLFVIFFIYILGLSIVLAQGKKIRVTAESADIYIEPHKSSTVIEKVAKGMVLNLYETSSKQKDWYYVSFYSETKWATITGFIKADLAVVIEAEEPEAVVEKKVPAKRPKAEKPAPKPVVKPKKETQPVEIPAAEETEPEEPQVELIKYTGKIKIVSDDAVIRSFAGKEGRVIQRIERGEESEISGKKGAWFQVKYPRTDGIILVGYIHQSHVEVLSGEPPEPAPSEEVREAEIEAEAVKVEEEAVEVEELERPLEKRRDSRIKIGLGVFAGYGLPSESNYSGGMRFGGSLTFLINDYLAVEISDAYFRTDVTGEVNALSKGRLTKIPLIFSLQGRYPFKDKFVPYLAVGAGYAFNSFSLDSEVKNPWNELGFTVDEAINNAFAVQFGGGLDYFINQNVAVFIDFRYMMMSASGSWHFTDQVSGIERSGDLNDLKLNSLFFGLGVKIYLGIF